MLTSTLSHLYSIQYSYKPMIKCAVCVRGGGGGGTAEFGGPTAS